MCAATESPDPIHRADRGGPTVWRSSRLRGRSSGIPVWDQWGGRGSAPPKRGCTAADRSKNSDISSALCMYFFYAFSFEQVNSLWTEITPLSSTISNQNIPSVLLVASEWLHRCSWSLEAWLKAILSVIAPRSLEKMKLYKVSRQLPQSIQVHCACFRL